MIYDPTVHQRRSIRLKGYDYAQAGAYFVTICTHKRQPIFGQIVGAGFTPAQNYQSGQPQGLPRRDANGAGFTSDQNTIMQLNEFGRIAHEQWMQIPARFENVELDEFVIMPNHMHGIIIINETQPVGAGVNPAPTGITNRRLTIGEIVGAYKSMVANECLQIFKTNKQPMGKLWQRNYYEHIIRDEKSYLTIVQYILDNPTRWELDSLYLGENP